jgi:Flp pilus assembly protein TadD
MKQVTLISQGYGQFQTINRCLTEVGCPDPQVVETHSDALAAFVVKRPDIVVYDWSVSDMQESCAFLQKLRKSGGCRGVPILVFAKELSAQLVAIGTEYGFTKVLTERSLAKTLSPAIESILSDLARPSSLRTQLLRLDSAFEKKAYGEVDRLVEDFYHLHPEHPRAVVEYSNLCIRRGNWTKASQVAQTAREKFPDNLRVSNLSIRIAMHEGDKAGALALLEKSDLLSPKNIERMVLFGDVFRASGDNDSARAFYDQALEVDPQNPEARKGLGVVELSEGDINSALDLFRDSASEEEIGGFFNNTAVLAVREMQFEKAVRLYKAANRALNSKVLKAKVTFNLGLAYRKWNKQDEAVRAFCEAVDLDPAYEKAQKVIESYPAALVESVRATLAAKPSLNETVDSAEEDLAETFESLESEGDSFAFEETKIMKTPPSKVTVTDTEKLVHKFSPASVSKASGQKSNSETQPNNPQPTQTQPKVGGKPVDKKQAAVAGDPLSDEGNEQPVAPSFLNDEEDF